MALKILFLVLSFAFVATLIVTGVGYLVGMNLYRQFGRQLFDLFGIFVILMIAVYIVLSLLDIG